MQALVWAGRRFLEGPWRASPRLKPAGEAGMRPCSLFNWPDSNPQPWDMAKPAIGLSCTSQSSVQPWVVGQPWDVGQPYVKPFGSAQLCQGAYGPYHTTCPAVPGCFTMLCQGASQCSPALRPGFSSRVRVNRTDDSSWAESASSGAEELPRSWF